jgi:hypothetical protein
MTDNDEAVARIVGSGAPTPDPDDAGTSGGDLEYDEVHEFLAEMDARQDRPPGSAPHAPAPN